MVISDLTLFFYIALLPLISLQNTQHSEILMLVEKTDNTTKQWCVTDTEQPLTWITPFPYVLYSTGNAILYS